MPRNRSFHSLCKAPGVAYRLTSCLTPGQQRPNKRIIRMRLLGTGLMLAALCLSSTVSLAADIKRTLTIRQEKPALSHVDLGASGASHGDILAFEAAISAGGDVKGIMYGMLTTVGIPEGDDSFEDRVGQIFLNFGGGHSIVVSGMSVYKDNAREMDPGAPQLRAVVGGTGDYIGARGQMTTTRNADGSYEHVVELLD